MKSKNPDKSEEKLVASIAKEMNLPRLTESVRESVRETKEATTPVTKSRM